MSLPEWIKAKCRAALAKPGRSTTERASLVKELAFRYGYLYDHQARAFVYVGDEPEPRNTPIRQ